MKKERCVVFFLLVLFSLPIIRAQDVELELQMPVQMFLPGETFWLDLHILNHGPDYTDAQLFIAFNIGTDDYWFYPSWCHYPDEVDYEVVSVFKNDNYVMNIIPEFKWPKDAGKFDGAVFLSALVHDGNVISNLAQVTFGWTVFEKFVYIPPGTFQMGSPDNEICRSEDEGPVHTVTITHGFYMLATEVTQYQWAKVFGNNPADHDDCLICPVEFVTWYDCCIYCNKLSMMEGLEPCYYSDASCTTVFDGIPPVTTGSIYWKRDADGYRLPTEAEWEYACRAGSTTAYNSGQDNTSCDGEDPALDPLGWYAFNSSSGFQKESHPVGMKQPNAWGLYDMHGNIAEWCWDYFDPEYYQTSPSTDPTGPDSETGRGHVTRGGSFYLDAEYSRSANRESFGPPLMFSRSVGFRIVRSVQ